MNLPIQDHSCQTSRVAQGDVYCKFARLHCGVRISSPRRIYLAQFEIAATGMNIYHTVVTAFRRHSREPARRIHVRPPSKMSSTHASSGYLGTSTSATLSVITLRPGGQLVSEETLGPFYQDMVSQLHQSLGVLVVGLMLVAM